MTSGSSAYREALAELARTVEVHGGSHGVLVHTRVLDVCAESILFGLEGEDAMIGTRTRSAAHLLLELTCPDLDATAVRELSVACERAVTRLP